MAAAEAVEADEGVAGGFVADFAGGVSFGENTLKSSDFDFGVGGGMPRFNTGASLSGAELSAADLPA